MGYSKTFFIPEAKGVKQYFSLRIKKLDTDNNNNKKPYPLTSNWKYSLFFNRGCAIHNHGSSLRS